MFMVQIFLRLSRHPGLEPGSPISALRKDFSKAEFNVKIKMGDSVSKLPIKACKHDVFSSYFWTAKSMQKLPAVMASGHGLPRTGTQ
jgi:hypothetical protein